MVSLSFCTLYYQALDDSSEIKDLHLETFQPIAFLFVPSDLD